MANSAFVGERISRGPHPWRRQLHRGWVDAQHGQSWPREYDTMSNSEQIAYESGRLLIREAMAEGFALCVWRGDKASANAMDDLWDAVCRRLGRRVTPETWVEPLPEVAT